MKESTPLFNNGLRSNSSETIESSTSTFVVDINQGNNDGGDDLKQYGALDDSCNCAQQIGEDDQVPVIRGIADMFLSCFSFAIMHLTMKFLIKDNYPVSQLLLFRSVTTAVGCSIYAYYAKIPGGPFGPPEDRFWLNFRGTLGAISIVTFFLSLENLTLGDTLALSFISPVIMPILSSFWLGEDYTSVDALATFIAMTGVTFISKPEFLFGTDDPNGGSSGLGIFYAVIAASTGALSNISIRKISKKSTSIHIVNYMMLWTLPVCLGMIYNEPAAFKFELGYFQAGQFLIVAFFSFIGQYWLGRSLLTTPARFVSPIMFTQVFYAYINQYVFWGIMPTSSSTVGVALVACSLILLHYKI